MPSPFFFLSAFGLRFSLFDRTCPLAIVFPFGVEFLLADIRGPRIGAQLQPLEQVRPVRPGVGATFVRTAHMIVDHVGGAGPVGIGQRTAALRRILRPPPVGQRAIPAGLRLGRDHAAALAETIRAA